MTGYIIYLDTTNRAAYNEIELTYDPEADIWFFGDFIIGGEGMWSIDRQTLEPDLILENFFNFNDYIYILASDNDDILNGFILGLAMGFELFKMEHKKAIELC